MVLTVFCEKSNIFDLLMHFINIGTLLGYTVLEIIWNLNIFTESVNMIMNNILNSKNAL